MLLEAPVVEVTLEHRREWPQAATAERGLCSRLQPRLDFVSHKPTCLVVEDEVLIGIDLEEEIGAAGFTVSGPFPTCQQALESLDHDPPSVAVLDTMLKDGPCLGLARELRHRGIQFIIYSGREERHQDAPELDGVRWIPKPAPPWAIVEALREIRGEPVR